MDMEHELATEPQAIIPTSLSPYCLNPCPSHFLNNRNTEPLNVNLNGKRSESMGKEEHEKISQSRGL